MPIAFIALGSNLGDREKNIKIALEKIQNAGVKILKISRIIETEPYGYLDQGKFLNAVCMVETNLSPRELLELLLGIEKEMGRVRKIKWGPRNIDLDIIFYEDYIINEEDLIIPHPDAHNRAFVIDPLCEIAPDFVHPVIKKKIREIKENLHT
ncbi:MAG: 2-amino-4-hydroxy-6-hydroxymethyldihydropteridine diphosphokinase [Dictyoglomus sp. NZ13-RE01]|nr:MAG: 2-amino-4-hydroxy-6-hydroxymethyldihydropteridine diphosphokinase [Dictyoglomus sp. NZ13-RE01]